MRRLLLIPIACVLLAIALWALVRGGDGPVGGLRIDGAPIDPAQPLRDQLEARAKIYVEQRVVIRTGPSTTQRLRRELGVSLDVDDVVQRAGALGRSGHLLADLRNWWSARRGRLNLECRPKLDEQQLAAFVVGERARLELPPKVGVSDGQGWSLPGEDGVSLDYHAAMTTLKRALTAGKTRVELTLVAVPPPEPIVIGAPDGALFDEADAAGAGLMADESARDEVPPEVWAGLQWLPSRGDECHERPPLPPYCEGPRMVPRTVGPAASLSAELGLGGIAAVARLIARAPDPRWVAAAGGPLGRLPLSWPVDAGRFGRGFGYVRKRAEVRDQLHKGVDIPARIGSAIRASSDAITAYSDNGVRGYGNLLILVHADGSVTFNAHCRRIFVAAGQRVRARQIVAEIGSTGMSMGPHLHFEYHLAGQPIDPDPLFVQRPRR